jgi:hypothetical protein
MLATFVRIWLSVGMNPFASTSTPALSAPIFRPFGTRPTDTRIAS